MKPWVQPPTPYKMGVVVMLVISALGGWRRKENEKLRIISGHIESFRSVVTLPWTHRIWPDLWKEAGLWLVTNWLGGSTPAWDSKTKIIPKQNQLPVPQKPHPSKNWNYVWIFTHIVSFHDVEGFIEDLMASGHCSMHMCRQDRHGFHSLLSDTSGSTSSWTMKLWERK